MKFFEDIRTRKRRRRRSFQFVKTSGEVCFGVKFWNLIFADDKHKGIWRLVRKVFFEIEIEENLKLSFFEKIISEFWHFSPFCDNDRNHFLWFANDGIQTSRKNVYHIAIWQLKFNFLFWWRDKEDARQAWNKTRLRRNFFNNISIYMISTFFMLKNYTRARSFINC